MSTNFPERIFSTSFFGMTSDAGDSNNPSCVGEPGVVVAETDKEGPMAELITVVGAGAMLTVGEGRVTATDESEIGGGGRLLRLRTAEEQRTNGWGR